VGAHLAYILGMGLLGLVFRIVVDIRSYIVVQCSGHRNSIVVALWLLLWDMIGCFSPEFSPMATNEPENGGG